MEMENEKLKEQSLNLKVSESDSEASLESIVDAQQKRAMETEMTPGAELSPAENVRSIERSEDRRRFRGQFADYSEGDSVTMSVTGLILFLFFAMMTYSTIWSYPWQSSWARVDGRIAAVRYGSKGTTSVTFTYPVGQQIFNGSESFRLHGPFLSLNKTVTVRYDPKAPASSKIETGLTVATFCWLAAALASFGFAVSGISGVLKKIH